jgi:hypothetical protein
MIGQSKKDEWKVTWHDPKKDVVSVSHKKEFKKDTTNI